MIKGLIITLSTLVLAWTWREGIGLQAVDILWSSWAGKSFLLLGGAYGLLTAVWCFWRLWLSLRYRPTRTVRDDSRLPRLTVIVPAYNEGALVGETLRCLAASDYPNDLLEIVVVDDGSDDDTWQHIRAAAREIGPLVRPIRCSVNRGKRHALHEGFRRGHGDVFVTVDSDSLVEADSLRALVSPMVRDSRVGAVAGNVRVLDRHAAFIPRLMAVRYVMTFDYKRAAQSVMGGGSLVCCAGALAAYRRRAVDQVLDRWLHQRFCGRPARAGEDHAMTNFILSLGLHVRYQRTARVYTKTPTTYWGLSKMFLRWARSNVRETLHMGRFVFTPFRSGPKLGIRWNYLMGALGLFLPYPFLFTALFLALLVPAVFGVKLLATCILSALFTVAFYVARERSSEGLFGIPYALLSTLLLSWIGPYALLTCQKSVWLTRSPSLPESRPSVSRSGTRSLAIRTKNLRAHRSRKGVGV